jgi:polysaccharide export outer membrane protein
MEREKPYQCAVARPWLVLLIVLSALALLQAACRSPGSQFSEVPGIDPKITTNSLPGDPGHLNQLTNCLVEGDVLAISFRYSTNFNATQKIGLDGTLNLDTVGQVKAAGKTPLQLEAELSKLYAAQVKDDVITVRVVTAIASIYVSGAVLRPGKMPLDRPLTAFEAIMEAGGFDSTRAKLSDVTVFRLENGRQRVYHVDFRKVLHGKDENPFYLRPFDIVQVPYKTFNF